MNMSNSSPLEQYPQRVERCVDDPARTEETPGELKDAAQPKKQKGPGSELAAADALRSLVDSPKKNDSGSGDELPAAGDSFVLPEIYTRSGRKKAIPFPLKLMRVLANKEYADVIAWLPNGKSFTIINPKLFTSDILPVHFKTAKYSSFTRKLHRWGFQRHLRGVEAGAFFHKDFLRNRVDLVDKMSCHKPKSSSAMQNHASPGASPSMTGRMPPRLAMPQLNQQTAENRGQFDSAQDNSELNDAIELEVARRLRERIAAASFSRQALAVMQQQQPMMDPLSMQLNAAAFNQHHMGGMNAMLGQAGMGHLNATGGLGSNPRFGGGGMSAAAALQQQALLYGMTPQQPQGLDLLNSMNNNNNDNA